MKNLLLLFFILGLTSCFDGDIKKKYCGVIVDKGYEAPTSGYKSSQDPCYFVIMKVDSINQDIRINVTVPTYYGLNKGDRTCFTLSGFELRDYGNGNNHLVK